MTTADIGVLDTNTLILIDCLAVEDLPAEPVITCVTLAELSVGPLATDDEAERAARQARLQEAEAAFEPLAFDSPAARAYGRVAASLRRAGREPTARAFDASSPQPPSPTTWPSTPATLGTSKASMASRLSRFLIPTVLRPMLPIAVVAARDAGKSLLATVRPRLTPGL